MAWKNIQKEHAIECVVLSIQFAEALPTIPWRNVVNDAYKMFPSETHMATAQRGGPVQFGVPFQISLSLPSRDDIAGYVFRKMVDDVPVEDITIRRDFLAFGTPAYTRWAAFSKEAEEKLAHFLSVAFNSVEIAAVQLEYWDRFNREGDGTYADLFDIESPFLPSTISSQAGLWHSHVGFFCPDPNDNVLVNLNVDVVDIPIEAPRAEQNRSVGVYSLARVTTEGPKSVKDIFDISDQLHNILIENFRTLFRKEILEKIGMNA